MLMDANLQFSAAQAITASAKSAFYLDLLTGTKIATTGAYTANTGYIIGNATTFGEDFGIGRGLGTPRIVVSSGSGTPITATSLQVIFEGAIDVTATTTYAGLTWTPYIQTEAIPIASILASERICSFDWPKREIQAGLPRFVELSYVVAGSNFSGLTVNADVTLGPDDAVGTLGQYPSNY